ncbi:DUF6456 domain-containing protein [Neomegalonema perideroedes]|uniref:DUF6456 domain-containing protein n=1 Tax=Neomegalonema perideroedes TaxID=217219 RepID=UPI0012FDA755|nr:DUF6456 domain-containing protein [Neomegalonema perideroedes]
MSSGAIARVRSSEATHLITEAGRATLRRLTARVTWPDAPSAYAAAHALLQWRHVDTPGGKRGERERRAVNMGESVIGWLSSRGHISAAELEAGEALRRDFERAQLGPRVTQNWEGFLTAGVDGGRSGFTPSEAAEAARARLFSAFVVLGSDLADVALRAICFGEGLEAVEREMGWSARSGKIVLKIALRRLVEFYQIREGA